MWCGVVWRSWSSRCPPLPSIAAPRVRHFQVSKLHVIDGVSAPREVRSFLESESGRLLVCTRMQHVGDLRLGDVGLSACECGSIRTGVWFCSAWSYGNLGLVHHFLLVMTRKRGTQTGWLVVVMLASVRSNLCEALRLSTTWSQAHVQCCLDRSRMNFLVMASLDQTGVEQLLRKL